MDTGVLPLSAAESELKRLKQESARLSRELKAAQSLLDKMTKAAEAKEALARMMAETTARQQAYTDVLLKSCPGIILLLDTEGHIVLSTQVLLAHMGLHNFDIIKLQHYLEVLGPFLEEDRRENFVRAIESASAAEGPVHMDAWIDFSGKREKRYYSIEISGIDRSGQARLGAGTLIVFMDLTDFMREKQRAEAANRTKSDFLATMSHEIRTPMNAILGMSSMLERSQLDEDQQRYLREVKKSSQSLLTIINDILDFSKIEAGRMDLVECRYNLPALLDSLFATFSHQMEAKGLRFFRRLEGELPGWIFGDENRLRQVLSNLLSNALKYTVEGEIEWLISCTPPGLLRFDVKDTGLGIRAEDQSRLFLPFEQLDVRKNRNVIGTGLGLAISRDLCHLMGGRLWFDSEYGEGSTFHLELPVRLADEGPEEEAALLGEFHAPQAAALVVDDIDINLTVAEAMLSLFGITPDLASSGLEALKMVEVRRYDIIFMDHMMPGMDGLETTHRIRTDGGENCTTPIVALTANAISGMEERFLANGFDAFLAKPLDMNLLNQCLRQWLPAEYID